MPILAIDINIKNFVSQARDGVFIGNSSLHEILSETLNSEIKKSITKNINSNQLVAVKVNSGTSEFTHSLEEAIVSDGYVFRHIQIQIDLIAGSKIDELDIRGFNHLKLIPVNYGARSKIINFKHKTMKTRERHLIELLHATLSPSTLEKIQHELINPCCCQDALLWPVTHGVWEWLQQFGCINCGKRYICNCFKPAVEKYTDVARERQSSYSSSGWPHRFLKAIEESEYRGGICHLCTGKPSNLYFCSPMYGSSVRVKYGAYMRNFEIQDGLSERDAENKLRVILGIPKIGEGWVNETQLFKLVELLFSDHEVIREASPEWLGKQRLDIYIPDIALAIEYQGEQHYRPIALFGGEEGFKKTKERDKIKLKLCRENNIKVVYFSHKEDLSQSNVEKKLSRVLKSAQHKQP